MSSIALATAIEAQEADIKPAIYRVANSEGYKRLAADIPASLYRQVKQRTADHGISVREYIMELLIRDGL